MIDLSIIIVNYNNLAFLDECISSIYKTTKNLRFEIILIDNGSVDNSAELAAKKYTDIIVIKNYKNVGFSAANNRGLKIAKGSYVLFLNTDTVVKDGAIEKMVRFMVEHPDAGAVGPKLTNINRTPQAQGGIFGQRFWLSKVPKKVKFVIGACFLTSRKIMDQIGGFDENFFFSNEDLDLCLRIRKAGFNIYFLPDAEVVHYGGYSTKQFNPKIFKEGFRGGLYYSRKHYGYILFLIYRTLLLFFSLIMLFLLLPMFSFKKYRPLYMAYLNILRMAIKGEKNKWIN